jgi:hypothetical protein
MTRLMLLLGLGSLPVVASAQRVTQPATAIDTLIRFNVSERTWRWPFLSAHVGLSCQGGNLAIGTTTAPDSAVMRREEYCAGAIVEMWNSTLTLRNARGVVHLRMNRVPLARERPDSLSRPRR